MSLSRSIRSQDQTRSVVSGTDGRPLMTRDQLLEANPFQSADGIGLLELRARAAENTAERMRTLRRTSVGDFERMTRGRSARPTISFMEDPDRVYPPPPDRVTRLTVAEFVEQKRQVFTQQLLIDRRKGEIRRVQNLRQMEKKNIASEMQHIAEVSNQYKMTTNQLEAELQRARRTMEAAAKRRTDLQREYKQKLASVAVLEHDIQKYEEALEQARRYKEFLERFVPEGRAFGDVFTSPQRLMEEMESAERDNLFLVSRCRDIVAGRETGLNELHRDIDQTEAEREKVLASVPEVVTPRVPSLCKEDGEEVEAHLREVDALVRRTYKNCFGDSTEINTLSRLEKLELALNDLYAKSASVSLQMMIHKQGEKEKARREIQRREKVERQEREQRRKLAEAMARAREPVKRRTGRPLHERTLPIQRMTDAQTGPKGEDDALEQLLWGSELV